MPNPGQDPANIYDVAASAEVSITTVSRYLNSPESVRTSTGEKIARAMEELDYIPNGNRGSRGSRQVSRIGVLTPFFPAPSFVDRLEGLMPVLKQNNYEMVIYTVEDSNQLDEYLNSVPFTRRLDGLILISVKLKKNHHQILASSGIQIVMIESDDDRYTRVLANDFRGGEIAAELFLEKNYFHCLYMGEKELDISYSMHPSENRLRGFKTRLEKAGIKLDHILLSQTTVEDSHDVFSEYLKSNPAPRAVFAMSDLQAIGIINALKEEGIKIPEETAVLGFDDISPSSWLGLSTITQNLQESGRVAGNLLMERIKKDITAIQQFNLQVNLVERFTT
jgi:DNA-binding LacI/PurR family transcriptional regulator